MKVWRGNGKEFLGNESGGAGESFSLSDVQLRELGFELVEKEPLRVEFEGRVWACYRCEEPGSQINAPELDPFVAKRVRVVVEEIV